MEGSKGWWPLEGSNAWQLMEGSKGLWPLEGSNVWCPMEREGKTPFHLFDLPPNKFYLNLHFFH
jgi:hypothetical protein